MLERTRPLAALVLALALVWHALAVLAPPKLGGGPLKETAGRDFASYYYAVQVAAGGGDPYDVSALDEAAQVDGTRSSVHPFFYPPPYLLAMVWALPFELLTGYHLWYWLNELALVVAAVALWRWWRPLGSAVPVALALTIAAMTAVPYSHQMGQVNFLVLALVVVGLWRERQEEPVLAGALVGLACMLKMSPAVFVAWWMLHRRWKPAAIACATAVLLSVLSLPLVGLQEQLRFYTEILPKFGTGDYNGLVIQIDMFGNHSVPNLLNQLAPGEGNRLSAMGQAMSTGANLALVGALGWLFRNRPLDDWQFNAQAAAVACASLLIPVYTYEHHLVWALPAMALGALAVVEGRLTSRWTVPVAIALVALCFPLPHLKQLKVTVLQGMGTLEWLVQELKFAGLLAVFAAMVRLGGRR